MIKAVIVEEHWSSGCGEWSEIADDPEKPPTLPGAILEEWIHTETVTQTTVLEYKQEARLDDEGKPYIYYWQEYSPEVSYEDWCKKGFDHQQKKIEASEREWPKWEYTRSIKKYRWVVVIEHLEQLEELLEFGAELSRDHYSFMPDLEYILRIDA